jgi:hypothetical protein
MEHDWLPVFTTDKIYEAKVAQDILTENGIDSFIINKMDSVFLIGEIEVVVSRDSLIQAKHLLKSLEG